MYYQFSGELEYNCGESGCICQHANNTNGAFTIINEVYKYIIEPLFHSKNYNISFHSNNDSEYTIGGQYYTIKYKHSLNRASYANNNFELDIRIEDTGMYWTISLWILNSDGMVCLEFDAKKVSDLIEPISKVMIDFMDKEIKDLGFNIYSTEAKPYSSMFRNVHIWETEDSKIGTIGVTPSIRFYEAQEASNSHWQLALPLEDGRRSIRGMYVDIMAEAARLVSLSDE